MELFYIFVLVISIITIIGVIFGVISIYRPDSKTKRFMKKQKEDPELLRDFTVIAVDFDGTLCEDKYPFIGDPNMELIEYLRYKQRHGAKIILWTCRCGELLLDAVDWCEDNYGLVFNAVNANIPEMIDRFGGTDPRKVYADIYIDDHAIELFDLPYESEG